MGQYAAVTHRFYVRKKKIYYKERQEYKYNRASGKNTSTELDSDKIPHLSVQACLPLLLVIFFVVC